LDRTSGARQQGAPSIWTESIQTGGMGVHRRRIGRGRDRRSDKNKRKWLVYDAESLLDQKNNIQVA